MGMAAPCVCIPVGARVLNLPFVFCLSPGG
jgi:hypothetical protein